MGVGMPASLKLHEFGSKLWDAFDEIPYQVGSSIVEKVWRDVDVRVMLDDEVYTKMFGDPERAHDNPRWITYCLAFSALGVEMTGLPIDFQVQPRTWANATFPSGFRSAIGIVPLRRK